MDFSSFGRTRIDSSESWVGTRVWRGHSVFLIDYYTEMMVIVAPLRNYYLFTLSEIKRFSSQYVCSVSTLICRDHLNIIVRVIQLKTVAFLINHTC